jgi:hypothetical protein
MLADLDLLLITVYCAADDTLLKRAANARRRVTDAEIVTLAVAQAVLDIPSDRAFLRAAARGLHELFPQLPRQDGYWKRRTRLAEAIEALMAAFARDTPGHSDSIVLLDCTPVECGRSIETARRSQLADACSHGYSRSHSRWFWGMRLHLLGAPDGTIRAVILASADHTERDVARRLFALALTGGETMSRGVVLGRSQPTTTQRRALSGGFCAVGLWRVCPECRRMRAEASRRVSSRGY